MCRRAYGDWLANAFVAAWAILVAGCIVGYAGWTAPAAWLVGFMSRAIANRYTLSRDGRYLYGAPELWMVMALVQVLIDTHWRYAGDALYVTANLMIVTWHLHGSSFPSARAREKHR